MTSQKSDMNKILQKNINILIQDRTIISLGNHMISSAIWNK